ncbi:sulfite exporter TauE/SafE family protein [Georgenia satyanarayanai]|uniref:sulfite exporter TauE/SafE family protein n=1 Tax=Georgenia satyanarayanai TaxID=860221 RepID=UPI002040859F|nr:sulfite exporter TauE/SafE family protein [Georgenia satyanarayanai]MCM3661445.1 sulfite exporter TauE/SafE family protein [Georgenia satyanarayanai]
MSAVIAAGVGVLVGVVVGTLGAGGGILSLPILVYVLGQDPHAAATASLVIVGASSAASLVPHARRGNVQWRRGLVFGLLGAVGAVGGARLAALVDADLLMVLLAGLLLVVSAVMLRRSLADRRRGDDEAPAPSSSNRVVTGLVTVLVASLVGLLTGFFGVGGGFIVVPALLLVMRVDMRLAVGTSLLVIVVNAVLGLVGRVGQDLTVDWPVVAAFAVTSMLGGLLAGRSSARASPRTLSLLFALLLLAVAVVTGVQAVPALLAG